MLGQCFADRDIARLQERFFCILPDDSSNSGMLERWQAHAPGLAAVITGWDAMPISEAMLAAAPDLQAIVHAAGSIRPFIPDSIWESGVRVATANDALGKGVAETTIGMIIAGLKGFFPCANLTRSGNWQAAVPDRGFGRVREMYDVTIGIIGASRTGRHVLRLLSEFEANVILHDPHVSGREAVDLGATWVTLDELLRKSDVVSLHAPALPELRNMLGRREFEAMKDDAIFVNTARGMLVDEEALISQLETGRISAILDVTSPEPPASGSRLRSLPNVTLLPHIAGAISTGCLRMGRSAVDQLLQFARGEIMEGEITRERFATMA